MQFEVLAGGDLSPVVEALCSTLHAGDVVYLHGEIGAGKTTLIQACCRSLGITEPVTSPTFPLAHLYDGAPPVVHLDLYRLNGADRESVDDVVDNVACDVIAFIEWPEHGAAWLPPSTWAVAIVVDPMGTRQFTVTDSKPT